ncbi:hypothetical protein LMG31841_00378 [Paraburkholderia saeva]|uniref:Uncharacterized protein n=1 Tax=Paraburkholderia saeva TaxID=2777537 RepID=A0A9N8RRS5_9BURK|nr:hypothetical protein LMG31841_00378 [Paraburkholderia saeva]
MASSYTYLQTIIDNQLATSEIHAEAGRMTVFSGHQ